MRWSIRVAWRLPIVAILLLTAPSGRSQADDSTTPTAGGQTTLAFVTNNASDYWTLCRKGAEAAQREYPGVGLRFVMPADGTAATQKEDVNDLLAQGVQGIAVSPVDPFNQTNFLNGVAAKTNLITSDSDAPESKRLCYVGTDNHAAGMMAGRLIKEALPHGGKIMLFVGKTDAQNAHDRTAGIRDALRGSRVKILGVQQDDTDHARAKANAADTLVKYPHIAALVGLWSYNGPAILSAVRDAHRTGRVKIVCFDEEKIVLDGVRSREIYATVAQQPYEFGYRSIKLLAQIARGDRAGVPASGRLIVPTLAITHGNVGAFQRQRQTRLAAPSTPEGR